MYKMTMLQGEAKYLPFLVRSQVTGQPLDLSTATLLLWIKAQTGDAFPVVMKLDAAFDKTLASSGRVSVFLTAYDTMQEAPWTYFAELKVVTATGSIYKMPFEIEILPSDSPNDWSLAGSSIASAEAVGDPSVTNL